MQVEIYNVYVISAVIDNKVVATDFSKTLCKATKICDTLRKRYPLCTIDLLTTIIKF